MSRRTQMQAERWKKVEELCQAAVALPPDKRGAFLTRACPDEALRAEVECCWRRTPIRFWRARR